MQRYLVPIAISAMLMTSNAQSADTEVNIYSYRQPALLQPLLDGFTKTTGIKANVVYAKKGLVERVLAEGKNSPVDVILTVDISRLEGAKNAGITQAVQSNVISDSVPAQFRDADNHWVGLTLRGRVIYASKDRVTDENLKYEDLADKKWLGKVCTRSGHHVYNVALISSLIAHHGESTAETWLEGVKANLARKPTGNDRAQVKAIYAGLCDVSLGNTYYMGKMLTNKKNPEQVEWANSVRIIFPNAEDRGTHVNISGAALAKYAPHKEAGQKLIEYLTGDEAQALYAQVNFEYPVKASVPASDLVKSWGPIKADTLPLNTIAENAKKADEIVDRVGFEAGPSS